jgi:hypothetical protein
MLSKENLENCDPACNLLMGADPGKYSTMSCVQEYYHSIDAVEYADLRKSLDGSNVLVEQLEKKSFVELTYRGEGFVAKPVNDSLPIHYQELLETPSSIQGSVQSSDAIAIGVETNSGPNNQKNIQR